MVRSRSLVVCLLIIRMFMVPLVCLDKYNAVMGYGLLSAVTQSNFSFY